MAPFVAERRRLEHVTILFDIESYSRMAHGATAKHAARCDQKHTFENIYKITTQHYSQAVELLAHNADGPTGEDYKIVLQLVDDARAKSEEARIALLAHIEEHRC